MSVPNWKKMELTQEEFKQFKKVQTKAAENEEENFTFKGETFNTLYAEYLIQYLEL